VTIADRPGTYEMAFVLFMDIVGYSVQKIDQQRILVTLLQNLVKGNSEFQRARAADELIVLPTGDGMALVFMREPLSPVKCALELADAVRNHMELKLRMGIHAGPVCRHADIKDEINVVGGGINIAQRVMDCGDAGHILLSRNIAEVLEQVTDFGSALEDLGTHEVKNNVSLHLFNFRKGNLGNSAVPAKITAHSDTKQAILPTTTSAARSEESDKTTEQPLEYFCYISRDKVDQLVNSGPETAVAVTDVIPELWPLLEYALCYGRPDLLQRDASTKRTYAKKLDRFLKSHAHEIAKYQPDSVPRGLFWVRAEFRVEEIDQEALIASLVSVAADKLVLHCSLANFSNKCTDGQRFQPNSTNYAFFKNRVPVALEAVFYLLSKEGDTAYGSPLFLKLPLHYKAPNADTGGYVTL
jgi:class 3 adenylate cyclase